MLSCRPQRNFLISMLLAVIVALLPSNHAYARIPPTGSIYSIGINRVTKGLPGNNPPSQPPGHKTPGTPPHTVTITYTAPTGCGSYWHKGNMFAYCLASTSKMACQNLRYYGLPQGATGFNNNVSGSCGYTWKIPGTPPFVPPTVPIPTNQAGTSNLAIQGFDSLVIPAPVIAGLLPSLTSDPAQPWVYSRLPTQVSVNPSSLQPVVTTTAVTNNSVTWNGKTINVPVTATITATLIGYYWVPEAAYVNGELNVATPPGGQPGSTPGSTLCNVNQNSLVMGQNDNIANPSICEIDFIQPSTKTGWTLTAQGMYSGVGTITYTTPWDGVTHTIGPEQLGTRTSLAASIQVPVANLEAVNCTTAACVHAGLAPSSENITPY